MWGHQRGGVSTTQSLGGQNDVEKGSDSDVHAGLAVCQAQCSAPAMAYLVSASPQALSL